ncbi:unnamed protein product, partial [Arabidopsis halleri]
PSGGEAIFRRISDHNIIIRRKSVGMLSYFPVEIMIKIYP